MSSAAERRPGIRRHVIAVVAIVIAVGAISYAVARAKTDRATPPTSTPAVASATLHVGSVAPTGFRLPRLLGAGSVTLRSLVAGHATVINFFASWCTVCQQELATFAAFAKDHGPSVQLVGVDTDDATPASARRLVQAAHVTYPVLLDGTSAPVATAYGISSGLPVTFFVNAKGKVVSDLLGLVTPATLASRTKTLASS